MMWATHLPTFVVLLQMALAYKTLLPKRLQQVSSPLPLVRHKRHLHEAKNSDWTYENATHDYNIPSSTANRIFRIPNQTSSKFKKLQKLQSFFHRNRPTTSSSNNLWKHHSDLSDYDLNSIASTDSGAKVERFQRHEESADLLQAPISTIASLNPSDAAQPVVIGVSRAVKQNTYRKVTSSSYDESFGSKPSFKIDRSLVRDEESPISIQYPESNLSDKDSSSFISASLSLPASPAPEMLVGKESSSASSQNGRLDTKSTHRFRKIRSFDQGCHSQHLKKCGSNVIKEFSAGIVSLSSKCQIRKEFLDCMVKQREIECAPETPGVPAGETEPIRNNVTNLLRSVNGCLLL